MALVDVGLCCGMGLKTRVKELRTSVEINVGHHSFMCATCSIKLSHMSEKGSIAIAVSACQSSSRTPVYGNA